jgi:hypothetical protein
LHRAARNLSRPALCRDCNRRRAGAARKLGARHPPAAVSHPRILDLARERAAEQRRLQAEREHAEMEARRGAALAVRDSLVAVVGEADPTYPALLMGLDARPLTNDERAGIGLEDDPQDGAVALTHGEARFIARVTRVPGRGNTVRWRIYGDGIGPLETEHPYGQGAGDPAVGQTLWEHVLDALAPAAERMPVLPAPVL